MRRPGAFRQATLKLQGLAIRDRFHSVPVNRHIPFAEELERDQQDEPRPKRTSDPHQF